ncbi:MAG: Mpo1-like protein [Alphaproteobacteria bacterium]
MARRCSSYGEFWPVYLREHSRPRTRLIHFVGTGASLLALIVALATQTWWLLIVVPIAGYAPAWYAHFVVERNRPATFTHPFWSLISDFRMFFLWCAGQLEPELRRAGIVSNP